MARNGSGTYSLPSGNPVVTGTTISSTVHNTTMSDVASELTNSIDKDGQTVITGTLDFNGNEIILDADGDTTITVDTDDQIDVKIGGSDQVRLTPSTITAGLSSGSGTFRNYQGGANFWDAQHFTDNSYRWNYNATGNDELILNTSGDLLPGTTESQDLGSASLEWDNIYLQNAATVSDRRTKNDLGGLDDKWVTFFDALDARLWTRKSRTIKDRDGKDVELKHSRPHTSFHAQDVKAALDAAGIDDWAGYVYDEAADKHLLRPMEFIAPLLHYVKAKVG